MERQGRGCLGGGGSALGILHSLSCDPHSIQGTHPLSLVHQGQSPGDGSALSGQEGSVRVCSSSLSGLLQPIICGDEGLRVLETGDLSSLKLKVLKTSFKTGMLQLALLSIQEGDWMVSLDLKDAYLQVPIHPDSRKYLRFVASCRIYQFKALCFGLSMAPQVFTRVMALVSAMLHSAGICIRRYLDDWLIQAASRVQVLQALETVLRLCRQLGIVVNWEKSHLEPAQRVIYLGVLLDSVSFRASPAQKRVEKLLSIGD